MCTCIDVNVDFSGSYWEKISLDQLLLSSPIKLEPLLLLFTFLSCPTGQLSCLLHACASCMCTAVISMLSRGCYLRTIDYALGWHIYFICLILQLNASLLHCSPLINPELVAFANLCQLTYGIPTFQISVLVMISAQPQGKLFSISILSV